MSILFFFCTVLCPMFTYSAGLIKIARIMTNTKYCFFLFSAAGYATVEGNCFKKLFINIFLSSLDTSH